MMMEIPTTLKAVGLLIASVGSIYGGVMGLDMRYEQKEVHEPEHVLISTGMETFAYSIMKKEIREIRELLYRETDPARKAYLILELNDAIDRLCIQFPKDRECK